MKAYLNMQECLERLIVMEIFQFPGQSNMRDSVKNVILLSEVCPLPQLTLQQLLELNNFDAAAITWSAITHTRSLRRVLLCAITLQLWSSRDLERQYTRVQGKINHLFGHPTERNKEYLALIGKLKGEEPCIPNFRILEVPSHSTSPL